MRKRWLSLGLCMAMILSQAAPAMGEEVAEAEVLLMDDEAAVEDAEDSESNGSTAVSESEIKVLQDDFSEDNEEEFSLEEDELWDELIEETEGDFIDDSRDDLSIIEELSENYYEIIENEEELFLASSASNQATIYSFLRNTLGLNVAAACGVLANIENESGFDPNERGDSGTSYGLCQWHDTRWTDLKNYRPDDWSTVNGQLAFLKYELGYYREGSVLSYLKNVSNDATGVYNAAYYWCRNFEVPEYYDSTYIKNGKTYINECDYRGQYARDNYWPQYGGEAGPSFDSLSVSNITNTNATISSWVSNTGEITEMGYYLGTSDSYQNKIVMNRTTVSWTRFELKYNLVESYGILTPGQTYTYVFYVVNNGVEYHSSVGHFTTSGSSVISFDTYSVSDVTDTNAKTGAWFSNDTGANISSLGFYYGTDPSDLKRVETKTNVGWTRANLAYNLLDYIGGPLKAETNYMVRYYAAVNGTNYYSDYLYFTTLKSTDTQSPSISNITISDMSVTGYTVTCTVTDNVGVTRVKFPAGPYIDGKWTVKWIEGTITGTTASCRINASDFDNTVNCLYATHIYAYDAAGNEAKAEAPWARMNEIMTPVASTYYKGHVYDLYDVQEHPWSWSGAESYCEVLGGHLAAITSAEEQEIVFNLTRQGTSDGYWIGGSDRVTEGVWQWSSGEEFSYTNWQEGQPDNYNEEDYMIFMSTWEGKWNDVSEANTDIMNNNVKIGFVCERLGTHTHSYTATVTREATCTEKGVRTYTCSCGDSYTEEIPAKGHGATEIRNKVDATTLADGYTGDTYCTVCNSLLLKGTIIPKLTDENDAVAIAVENAKALAGKDIEIPVIITKNTGIAGFSFDIGYDDTILTLKSVALGSVLETGQVSTNGNVVNWYAADNAAGDGTILKLTFIVADTAAAGTTDISISPHEGKKNLVDESGNYVEANYQAGTLEIVRGIIGDVNGDEDITIADVVVLNRHVLGKYTLPAERLEFADVNGDGDITIGDVVVLNRHVLGRDHILAAMNSIENNDIVVENMQFLGASPAGMRIKVDSVTAGAGEKISLPVRISGNTGIAGFAFSISLPEGMTLDSIIPGELLASGTFSSNNNNCTWYAADNVMTNGLLMTLEITVGKDAQDGVVSVAVKDNKNNNLSNEDGMTVMAEFSSGTITVQRQTECEMNGHKGGTATCTSRAVCDVCHEEYGGFDLDNHAGTTEIRNQKDPTDKEDGYTGDVYCEGCGQKLSGGTVIKHTASTQTEDIPAVQVTNPEGDPGDKTSVAAAEKEITAMSDTQEPAGSSFAAIQVKSSKQTKNSITISWNKVNGATGYIIYGNQCGKNKPFKRLAKQTGTSYTYKKLKKGTYYKFSVVAYKTVKGKEAIVASGKTIHVATKGGKVTNVSKVKLSKSKVKLKKGGTVKVKATAVKQTSKLTLKTHRKIKFESSNKKVATVDKNGKIKAKGKGNCYIYAYSQNGVYARVKVTVKG